MDIPVIALVGGFLGAGKTTLILAAARILQARGMRVGVITNDQDHGLVDTRLAEANDIDTQEVTGGCFCCRFSDLIDAVERLQDFQPDVIFAEPVGSCMDLSATIAQPLKAFHSGSYRLAPLTVLFDPKVADAVYTGHADSNVEYLFQNQLDEADIICATKSDLYPTHCALPFPVDFSLCSRTGEGVDSWVNELLNGGRIAGSQILKVDYSRYADAEASLGWLNLHGVVTLQSQKAPAALAGPLLEDIDSCLTAAGIRIAHLKIFDRTGSGFIRAGICHNGDAPLADGDLLADPGLQHEIALNLRALGGPDLLAQTVSAALARISGSVKISHQSFFRPSPPKPEHRFAKVFRD